MDYTGQCSATAPALGTLYREVAPQPSVNPISKHQAQSKLDLPGCWNRLAYHTERRKNRLSRGCARECLQSGRSQAEVRPVAQVERLGAELDVAGFSQAADTCVLADR